MNPVEFEGSRWIGKPPEMTDEECFGIHAKDIIETRQLRMYGLPAYESNEGPYRLWFTAWKPSYEDMQALQRGEPIYIQCASSGLPPMAVFTLNEKGESNDAG